MATNHTIVPDRRNYSAEQFNRLMAETRFLFRCFSYNRFPGVKSPYKKDDGFVARKYSNNKKGIDVAALWAEESARYTSAVSHIDEDHKSNSPWVSTTRSWDWAIWWMALNKKPLSAHKLKIAVIDLTLLPPPVPGTNLANSTKPHQGIVLHALELISRAKKDQNFDAEKLKRVMNYANSADEVLVYAKIPLSAIVSTVTLDGLKLSIQEYIKPTTTENWARRVYDWAFSTPEDQSKKKNFTVARRQWVHKFREVAMNEDQWGEECAQFAFLLLRKQIIEIDKMLGILKAKRPAGGRKEATGTPLKTDTAKDKRHEETSGDESDEDDHDNPHLNKIRGGNFNKALEAPGLDMFQDAGASVESWKSLCTMRKRLSNVSMGCLDTNANDAPELSPLLWTNLSMLPKKEDLWPAQSGVGSSDSNQAVYSDEVVEARRRLNLFYDQLVMLASCIPEPYWHFKPHNNKDWANMKQAILKRSAELVYELEKTIQEVEQSDNQGLRAAFLNFEHEHRPHWWVYGPNM